MSKLDVLKVKEIYSKFDSSITSFDCGKKCSPYNTYGIPFCCDIGLVVPTAYESEWVYLKNNTDLWHLWEPEDKKRKMELQTILPDGQAMLACKGYEVCQREFRSIACRSFPFFPYIDREREFLGITYFWTYENQCWVISNLGYVNQKYVREFVDAYELIFDLEPSERENYYQYSVSIRRVFGRKHRKIILLHRNGNYYFVNPSDGQMEQVPKDKLPKFGVYEIASELQFPDEEENQS